LDQKNADVRVLNQFHLGWLDSACFDHACLIDFAREYPLERPGYESIKVANGRRLQQLGIRTVNISLGREKENWWYFDSECSTSPGCYSQFQG
jgi:hypothetical protein